MSTIFFWTVPSFAVLTLCAGGYALGAHVQDRAASPAVKAVSPLDRVKLEEGTWDATISMTLDPASPPTIITGTLTAVMGCNGKWLIEDFKSDSFQGHGIVGWDPLKQKIVSVWVDGESPSVQTGEGVSSADGTTRTMLVEGSDGSGKLLKMREVHVLHGPDKRSFTIYRQGADGKDTLAMSIEYKRRAAH